MNLTIKQKQIPIFFLLIALFTMVLVQGCTGVDDSSKQSCNPDTAPFGSKVTAPIDGTFTFDSATAATTDARCVNNAVFIFTDSNGKPLNDIYVSVKTSGYIAVTDPMLDCTDNLNAAASTSLLTRTNAGGTIALDIGSNIITKGTGSTDSEIVQTQVSSCTTGALNKTTITINWK